MTIVANTRRRWPRRIARGVGIGLALIVAAFASGVLWPLPELRPVHDHEPLVIEHVTVINVRDGRHLPDHSVLVADGRIVRVTVGTIDALPPGTRRIDGRGRWLMPALWDMHAHITALSPMLELPLYVGYGVTNVRDMLGCPRADDPFIACAEDKRRWSAEADRGTRVGPRIRGTPSFMANGPVVVQRMPDLPPFFAVATPQQARAFVRHHAGRVDAIKVYDRIPRAAYFALADEARSRGIDLVGHRPHAVSAIEAAARQKSIEHARFLLHESFPGATDLRARSATPAWREDRRRMLDEHDPALADAIFAAMREHGTWYVPTHLTRWADAYAERPEVAEDPLLRYLHPLLRRQWQEDMDELLAEHPSPEDRATYRDFHRAGLALTGRAHRAGVRILVGTDYIAAGADVHREMAQLVAAGLSPADALRAATLSPAEYFGLQSEYGTVEPGKVADLILLDADPLQDIDNTLQIHAVVFAGRLHDSDALRTIREHVEASARSLRVGCRIVWRFLKNPTGY